MGRGRGGPGWGTGGGGKNGRSLAEKLAMHLGRQRPGGNAGKGHGLQRTERVQLDPMLRIFFSHVLSPSLSFSRSLAHSLPSSFFLIPLLCEERKDTKERFRCVTRMHFGGVGCLLPCCAQALSHAHSFVLERKSN